MKPRRLVFRVDRELTAQERAHVHFWRRVWKRYGLALADVEIRAIEATIEAGRAIKTVDFSETRAGYSLRVRGTLIVVLYDHQIHAAVTALPMVAIARRIRDQAVR